MRVSSSNVFARWAWCTFDPLDKKIISLSSFRPVLLLKRKKPIYHDLCKAPSLRTSDKLSTIPPCPEIGPGPSPSLCVPQAWQVWYICKMNPKMCWHFWSYFFIVSMTGFNVLLELWNKSTKAGQIRMKNSDKLDNIMLFTKEGHQAYGCTGKWTRGRCRGGW